MQQGAPDKLHQEALLTAWAELGTDLGVASAPAWQREGRRLLRSGARWPRWAKGSCTADRRRRLQGRS